MRNSLAQQRLDRLRAPDEGELEDDRVVVLRLPAYSARQQIALLVDAAVAREGRQQVEMDSHVRPRPVTTADAADGTFAVDVTLVAGLNRLMIQSTTDGLTVRSWVGTNIELESIPALRRALPRGATVDIVYLP